MYSLSDTQLIFNTMKKQDRIFAKMATSKDLQKGLAKTGTYYSEAGFYKDAQRYIKAIKEGRMLCIIPSVSSSGMSRVIKFLECSKHKGSRRHSYLHFWALFTALGYQEVRSQNGFRIHGCGMDMVFHTNYSIMHDLCRLGFITRKQCDSLAQQTPTVL